VGPSTEQSQQQLVEVTRKIELPGLGADAANRLRERLSASDDPILQRSVGAGRAITERRISWYKFIEFVQSLALARVSETEPVSAEPIYSEETTARYNVTSAAR
jgi:hypothetical protein